jgi:hypothetical protein
MAAAAPAAITTAVAIYPAVSVFITPTRPLTVETVSLRPSANLKATPMSSPSLVIFLTVSERNGFNYI